MDDASPVTPVSSVDETAPAIASDVAVLMPTSVDPVAMPSATPTEVMAALSSIWSGSALSDPSDVACMLMLAGVTSWLPLETRARTFAMVSRSLRVISYSTSVRWHALPYRCQSGSSSCSKHTHVG